MDRHKYLSKEFSSHLKDNIVYDPPNPPKEDFRIVQVRQNTAKESLTPLLRGE